MNDPSPSPQGKIAEKTKLAGTGAEEPRTWTERLWRALHNLLRPPADVEDLREVVEELIEEPLSESGLSQEEHVLLTHLMTLRERKVSDCMIQRTDIISAADDASLSDLVDLMAAHGHSRIPIYRETLDDVVGMVHIKDIMPCIAYQQTRSVADLLRPVLFVAPSMAAAKLLLQCARRATMWQWWSMNSAVSTAW
ncbi:MAG: CBS domain-containing protein [Alphaproteobacteria bacterium]|nr:CBS domain-containing protein [Alphaproteobacteria bacterium]